MKKLKNFLIFSKAITFAFVIGLSHGATANDEVNPPESKSKRIPLCMIEVEKHSNKESSHDFKNYIIVKDNKKFALVPC